MARTVDILDGNTFVVSDERGDLDGSPVEPHGLFSDDTRYLSKWVLTLDGERLATLSVDRTKYFAAQFFLAPGTSSAYINAKVAVIRRREVVDGFHESITVTNHDSTPRTMELALEADADFADLFEVKDAVEEKVGEHYRTAEDDRLVLGYRRGSYRRETWVRGTDTRYAEDGLHFNLTLDPQQSWTTELDVLTVEHVDDAPRFPPVLGGRRHPGEALDPLHETAPVLQSDWAPLERIYDQSIRDLTALRFDLKARPGQYLPAAGLPWFMAAFGRDSLITSFQALPFLPELARTALMTLGTLQAVRHDPFRDAEPGKILHELRFGELTAFEERPHSPYYGAADATQLWLILLDEYERWTGRSDVARRLESVARAALRWIDESGDRDGDGYVEYERRNAETGLENQCWKDSWDSIQWADGTLASLPRATCELQGYTYDAKRRCARLAREVWDDAALADRLEREADELKERFNRDFWIEGDGPGGGYYALALDGQKRPVDALTSNIGHLLWSGIVPEDRAATIAVQLVGPRLNSGWGIRTFATGQTGFNPIGYHLGTVWPHDTALCVLGLLRYGYVDEAAAISMNLLRAAELLGGRLPEAFAGFSREEAGFPAEYPTACSPQAWASGAPLMLVRALLGLTPQGAILRSLPHLPPEIRVLHLRRVPGRWGAADVGVDLSDEVVRVGVRPGDVADLIAAVSQRIDPAVSVGRRLSIGFDLGDAGAYRLVLENGHATLDAHATAADCVVRGDEASLLAVLRNERSYSTAMMSDLLQVHGDRLIAIAFFTSASSEEPRGAPGRDTAAEALVSGPRP